MSTFVLGCGMGISACDMATLDSSIDISKSGMGTLSCSVVLPGCDINTPQALV